MIGARLRRALVIFAIALSAAITLGGGGTFVAMEITTKPAFCKSCHIMAPYYDSWASSTHSNVPCVDCHYEPGLLETFEGKFKALSQLAKYVTATQGTKPWAEVSDYSCMRSGCHSARLLEGEIAYGRIRFDHRHHLIGLRRGKRLRCTSCHSQIVQGSHVTVTKSSCILCHFKPSSETKPIDDCYVCHGPPPDDIAVGDFVFRHSDYLARGVKCDACHGDVTRGTGEVPRERCGGCHNVQAHLNRYEDVVFLHQKHVAEHSVDCLRCHTEIRHGLPSREQHYRGSCTDCHVGPHGVPEGVYRGTGGRGVEDNPGVMYLARVTCNGCHRPPFESASAVPQGATFEADPLACIECHGTGFEGMAARWQAEVSATVGKVREAVNELNELLGEEWEEGDLPEARRRYEAATFNLGLALLDKSGGVHNLPYVRDLLRRAAEDVSAGFRALDPDDVPAVIRVGPRVRSQEGCTQLCHAGAETIPVARAYELPFPHRRHLTKAKLDCSTCHRKEPHGTTAVRRSDCVSCHHRSDEPEPCAACHADVARFRQEMPEGVEADAMQELDCLACHAELAEGHSRARVMAACDDCHGEDTENFAAKNFQAWLDAARAPLREVEAALPGAPPERAEEARAELERLGKIGPFHNPAATKAAAERLRARLARTPR